MEKPPEFALHWARELGQKHANLKKLRGGINNMVYLCSTANHRWVIKGYPERGEGQHDRMKAEVQFLQYAKKVAPGLTPNLIYIDEHYQCVVMEHIEGRTFAEGIAPKADAIETAVKFIKLLNKDSELAKQWMELEASEGFLSLRDHITSISQRLEAMNHDNVRRENRSTAIGLTNQIRYELEHIKERTNNLIERGVISDCISASERIISPSDFGFHNAILTHKGVRFIDFEFAGWDDPAKVTLDFILQPHVPIASQESPLIRAWNPRLQTSIKSRCKVLKPILRLKWACIIVSILNPDRLHQLTQIKYEDETEELIEKQIQKATAYLARTEAI